MSNEELFVKTSLTPWEIWVTRATKLFDALSDERMLQELTPGKNRPIYILGHLLAVNDSMIPQLRLGEATHPELRDIFVTKPDGAVAEIPSAEALRQNWKDVHAQISGLITKLTPAEWLERHALVSEEDFAKEPHRNRLAILLSRTSHLSYHVGQLLLFIKRD
jgi:hypothetical protein